jgi:hypothetical protein
MCKAHVGWITTTWGKRGKKAEAWFKVVGHLSSKLKALNSNPSTTKKSWAGNVGAVQSSTSSSFNIVSFFFQVRQFINSASFVLMFVIGCCLEILFKSLSLRYCFATLHLHSFALFSAPLGLGGPDKPHWHLD